MLFLFSFLYPIAIYLTLRYFGLGLSDAMLLKYVPLLISTYVTLLLFISYLKKASFIEKFAKKFLQKEFSEKELAYINRSTFFWIAISCTNVLLHIVIIFYANDYYWIIYSSFGWYFVFLLGGILQYFHRRFVFLKSAENV